MTQTLTFQIPRLLDAPARRSDIALFAESYPYTQFGRMRRPGQLLHADMKSAGGRPLEGEVLADIHDQHKSNFKPEHIGTSGAMIRKCGRTERSRSSSTSTGPGTQLVDGFFQTEVCDWSVDMTIM